MKFFSVKALSGLQNLFHRANPPPHAPTLKTHSLDSRQQYSSKMFVFPDIYVCRLPPHKALYDGESEPLGWTWAEPYPPEAAKDQQKTSTPSSSSAQFASSDSVSTQPPSAKSPSRESATTSSAVSPDATASESEQVAIKPKSSSGEVINLTDVSEEDEEESSGAEGGWTRVPETQRPCVLVLDSLGCHDARRTRETLAG